MKFDHPNILFFLWGLVPLAGLLVYGISRHKKILARYAQAAMFDHILPGFSYGPKWTKAVMAVFATGFAVVAMAGPLAGYRWEKTTQKGVDIMIALDCSRSMLAQDVSPTRLTRAKREIIDLTRLMHSDRAGLVAFSGAAVLQCPLTLDYNAFGIFLDALNPDYLPVGGTDLTAALETCYNGFDPESTAGKAIILITDGEDTAGDEAALTKVVEKFAKEKIRIFAIGVGDPAGAPIPAKGGGFKKDSSGNIILSKVDEIMLKKITAMTQGRYVRSVAGDMDLEQIYSGDILGTMERKQLTQGRKKVWEKRFQWFLLPCVLLLIGELLFPQGSGRKRGVKGGRSLICLVIAMGLMSPGIARAGLWTSPVKQGMQAWENKQFQQAKKYFIDAQLKNPDDPRLYYNIGTAAYAAGEYDLAESNFAQAMNAKDRELKHNALYNLANTRYRKNNLDKAIEDYQNLLKEFPDDAQAKENLEFVKKKLEAQKQKQQQNQKKQDHQNQDKKNQDRKDQNKQNKNQDQENKDKQNKDQGDQKQKGQKDQSQKQEQGQDQKQGQKNQGDKAEQNNPEKNVPQPNQPQTDLSKTDQHQDMPEEKSQAQPAQAAKAGQGEKGEDKIVPAQSKMLENRLNRLADKPGMALIPQTGARNNDKDW
ncbi:VWA domain-containing protein [uncultured Desulfobacter sp.]|uniref:vWA domain-containing protein n=1 Tax=uncultured Desulfobacter sp. TaxID=240139 RepID=UPI0029F45F76|nr:VWA domain-containing protein [uncultured Desulfobacter sp.]